MDAVQVQKKLELSPDEDFILTVWQYRMMQRAIAALKAKHGAAARIGRTVTYPCSSPLGGNEGSRSRLLRSADSRTSCRKTALTSISVVFSADATETPTHSPGYFAAWDGFRMVSR
ncbi:hypothetical protein [Nocardia rhamnosiphila]|uniref:Uncharacterized protein n=1 Tax=Nocardia rhamnosiphila TaxID=426716 RepID=A0ABV2WXS7_9NOCA